MSATIDHANTTNHQDESDMHMMTGMNDSHRSDGPLLAAARDLPERAQTSNVSTRRKSRTPNRAWDDKAVYQNLKDDDD